MPPTRQRKPRLLYSYEPLDKFSRSPIGKPRHILFDPGVCRCCGNLKTCRVISINARRVRKEFPPSDIVADLFMVLVSLLKGPMSERLVCDSCIAYLRQILTENNEN